VTVETVQSGGFATQSCEAVLSWGSHHVVAVPGTEQIDIDVLGADLGFGVPVVAFDTRESVHDWRSNYEIWTLEKPPRLLRTLVGGDSYRAVDADFNRYVAIWTTDASAVEGFDGLAYSDYTSPPTIILRYEHGSLVDVSAWYRAKYDAQIRKLRSSLTSEDLADFKGSDGRLKFGSVLPPRWIELRKTKAAVLEIVWAYLYSGRPDQAWAELQNAWPVSDEGRVKSAIIAAHGRGIDRQVEQIASSRLPVKWEETPFVYTYLKPKDPSSKTTAKLNYGVPGLGGNLGPESLAEQGESNEVAADIAPRQILMWRPAPSEEGETKQIMQSEETIELTIDEAGKVRSSRMIVPKYDPGLASVALGWKFIPALRDGRPVAYRLKIVVNPFR
jgi:hypothetical protein